MEGIFTHFCVAECDPAFTQKQNARFAQALETVRAAGFKPIAHAAATSAMLRSEYQYDMVRAGIGLYGTLVPELQGKLQYAQTLCAKPIRMECIHEGDTVGYGRTFTARRDSRIITVPIGYGDGYTRILSNKADVLVCGKRAPIVGNVCMDMLMADVTDIPEANADSEVVLMGAQGSERITPDELAQLAGTSPTRSCWASLPGCERCARASPGAIEGESGRYGRSKRALQAENFVNYCEKRSGTPEI